MISLDWNSVIVASVIGLFCFGQLVVLVLLIRQCADRMASTIAAVGLLAVLSGRLVAWLLPVLLPSVGLTSSPGGHRAMYEITEVGESFGVAVGYALLVLAAFVGRPVTAVRSP